MSGAVAKRVAKIDWQAISRDLDETGYALTGRLLSAADCAAVSGLYDREDTFRSHVIMARHGFGKGEYKYFSYPLPPLIQELRAAVYPHVATVANCWAEGLGKKSGYPETLDEMLSRCHEAGQARPTPLLLRYGPADYNCLHPGPLRRACIPDSACRAAQRTGRRLQRRRVRAHRAAPAHAVTSRSRATWQRGGRVVRGQPPAQAGARGAPTGSICVTGSAGCGQAGDIPWG